VGPPNAIRLGLARTIDPFAKPAPACYQPRPTAGRGPREKKSGGARSGFPGRASVAAVIQTIRVPRAFFLATAGGPNRKRTIECRQPPASWRALAGSSRFCRRVAQYMVTLCARSLPPSPAANALGPGARANRHSQIRRKINLGGVFLALRRLPKRQGDVSEPSEGPPTPPPHPRLRSSSYGPKPSPLFLHGCFQPGPAPVRAFAQLGTARDARAAALPMPPA